MKAIKRDLYLCVSMTVLVFVCALAWGSPFVGHGANPFSVFARARQTKAQSPPEIGPKTARQGSGDCFALGIL
jgi:hypothetical protein